MFHYTSCGLRGIWLRNGYVETKTDYGEAIAINDVEGLHKAIGINLVKNRKRLSGAEVRFLRKELDWSQRKLGEILGVSENTVRGWENHRIKISNPADRLLRGLYQETVDGDGKFRELVRHISMIDRKELANRLELEETSQGWKKAA